MKKSLFIFGLLLLLSLPGYGAAATADQDHDQVSDETDWCPTIPAATPSGCPQVTERTSTSQLGIFVLPPATNLCNSCPCYRLDYAADLHDGDIFFSTLGALDLSTIYRKSNFYIWRK